MNLGATHYEWRPDVQQVVNQIERKFPNVRCNTYRNHPFAGWDHRSVDIWGRGGRGDPIDRKTGHRVVKFLWNLQTGPSIRHYIYLNSWWLRGVGKAHWPANDHSGGLRHVHVTYY